MNLDIINKVNESKRRTTLMNDIAIDWQYAQQLLPKVLNETSDKNMEFNLLATTLAKLLEDIEEGIKHLRDLIPDIENQ